jgi:hypothetical protein
LATSSISRKPYRRLELETLENRLLLSASSEQRSLWRNDLAHNQACSCATCGGRLVPALEGPAVTDAEAAPVPDAEVASALSSVPVLNSLPGARASLYLDFDGHFQASWGAFQNIHTPAFDQDGNASSFSAGELAAIEQIWRYVAEDYAPFNINVTTVEPTSFANGVSLRVAIGGTGSWYGGNHGGFSYINSFTNSIPNVAFVFARNLYGNTRYVGDCISHEAGHAFGLRHQSLYSGSTKTAEYYRGPGDGRAPLLGYSYVATRSLWWRGTTTSASTIQDDMAVLARAANGFGYRPDDHGNTAATATPLLLDGNQVRGAGIIATTADKDYFSFVTGDGTIALTVQVPASVNNLDTVLELRDAAGSLIASAAPASSFGATITATVSAGAYRLVVGSAGKYGDVGQYTVSGTIINSGNLLAAPTNLTAAADLTGTIDLTWTGNGGIATGFAIQRSTDGTTWGRIGTVSASQTTFSDADVVLGMTYRYVVAAFNAVTTSETSNQASASLVLAAPANLTAASIAPRSVTLTWEDVSISATGFRVQRRRRGLPWRTISAGLDVTTFTDLGVRPRIVYAYRVRTLSGELVSAPSNVVWLQTPRQTAASADPGASATSEPILDYFADVMRALVRLQGDERR